MRHWSAITESGTVLGMRILLLIYQLLGRWAFLAVLYPVIMYYYLLKRDARKASQQYLDRVRPYANQNVKMTSYRHFLTFGETLLDKLLVWMGEIDVDSVSFETDGTFEQQKAQKKGGIIIVSHLGNTEICQAFVNHQPELKLNLLVYTQHAKKFNALMEKFHHNKQIEMIQVTEMTPAFAMQMSERITAGEFVAIAGDRTPVTGGKRTSVVDFFGHQAAMPQGAFILAGLLRCPVFTLFCLKHHKKHIVYLDRFAEKVDIVRQQRDLSLQKHVQAYANRLQHYCSKAPLQWFNFYQFWLDPKEEKHGSNRHSD